MDSLFHVKLWHTTDTSEYLPNPMTHLLNLSADDCASGLPTAGIRRIVAGRSNTGCTRAELGNSRK